MEIKYKNELDNNTEMYKNFKCNSYDKYNNNLNEYQNEIINLSNRKNKNFSDDVLLNLFSQNI